jgi:hypothetical protein
VWFVVRMGCDGERTVSLVGVRGRPHHDVGRPLDRPRGPTRRRLVSSGKPSAPRPATRRGPTWASRGPNSEMHRRAAFFRLIRGMRIVLATMRVVATGRRLLGTHRTGPSSFAADKFVTVQRMRGGTNFHVLSSEQGSTKEGSFPHPPDTPPLRGFAQKVVSLSLVRQSAAQSANLGGLGMNVH